MVVGGGCVANCSVVDGEELGLLTVRVCSTSVVCVWIFRDSVVDTYTYCAAIEDGWSDEYVEEKEKGACVEFCAGFCIVEMDDNLLGSAVDMRVTAGLALVVEERWIDGTVVVCKVSVVT